MSVIRFTPEEILAITTFLQTQCEVNPEIYSIITQSRAYKAKSRHMDGIEKENVKTLIYWMMGSLYASNLFAYVMQYKEIAKPEEFYIPNNVKAPVRPAGELIEYLKSFDYNLADNNGNHYVEPLYYELYVALVEHCNERQKDIILTELRTTKKTIPVEF